jgi:hypothetical protein
LIRTRGRAFVVSVRARGRATRTSVIRRSLPRGSRGPQRNEPGSRTNDPSVGDASRTTARAGLYEQLRPDTANGADRADGRQIERSSVQRTVNAVIRPVRISLRRTGGLGDRTATADRRRAQTAPAARAQRDRLRCELPTGTSPDDGFQTRSGGYERRSLACSLCSVPSGCSKGSFMGRR